MDTTRSVTVILDPTGKQKTTTDRGASADQALTPRPATLDGLRLALLENTKTNAVQLLNEVAAELGRRYALASVTVYRKPTLTTPVAEAQLQEVARNSDVAIAGVGDCGSCSAATLADGILLERSGVPAVSICSDAFVASARAMARVYGRPDYEFAQVQHPVSYLGQDQLRERAAAIIPDILRILGVAA
jgi:hypothetical protein